MNKKKQWRNKKNLHHIVWQCNRWYLNVDIPENKIIVDIIKHDALNCLVWSHQSPKEQLDILYHSWWFNVLSQRVRSQLEKILNLSDEDFYIKEITYGKNRK